MIGFWTLFYKELLRFWKVAFQTVAAPVLTAMLYLMIFSHVLEGRVQVHGVDYGSFLIPGLVMMQILQNAFANSSSSLIQAKITGSIVFVLLPPISSAAFYAAYVLAAVLRGLMVALGVIIVAALSSTCMPPLPAGSSPSPCSAAACLAAWACWPASGWKNSINWPPSRISSSCR